MSELLGTIERITYQNPENGYTIAKMHAADRPDLTTVVGPMPNLQPGESIRCFGKWKSHLVYGEQFEVESYRTEMPAETNAIKKYLGSGLIKGIGPVFAERIVEMFGQQTLDVIDKRPDDLLEVEGIGDIRLKKIKACWHEQRSIRDVMIFLQDKGVSPAFAQRIYRTWGDASIEKIQENPFNLARDIFGVGFKTADKIAEKMGLAKDAPERIDAGIEYLLSELSSDGHVCYPFGKFLPHAQEMFDVEPGLISERIEVLIGDDRLRKAILLGRGEPELHLWITPLYLAEQGVVNSLWRLAKSPCLVRTVDAEKAIDWVQKEIGIKLAPKQQRAVAKALTGKLEVITGGPGTGKSTIIHSILTITEKLSPNILLAAPTGRAAKRMAEITGRKASTIHSLLEFDFRKGKFKKNRSNPLKCDLLIVDEASMIDTQLMNALLKAVPDGSRVVLVGDVNQLPSVGPGNVLNDIIASRRFPVTRLTEIFRQAAGSKITINAHRINGGIFPCLDNDPTDDFFFLEAGEPEEALQSIVDLVSRRLPAKYDFDPKKDIQVLTPMKKGIIGTQNLNLVLQETLNPSNDPLFRSGRRYHVGDKVMQMRNNYQKEISNGDLGIVSKIDVVEQQAVIEFDGRQIEYEFSELDEVVLAYAASIHKSQGSEFPCVVIPVHTTHFIMLCRNLFYTGVTRGKKLVVVVGTKKAMAIAVKNDEVKERHTALKEWITGEMKDA